MLKRNKHYTNLVFDLGTIDEITNDLTDPTFSVSTDLNICALFFFFLLYINNGPYTFDPFSSAFNRSPLSLRETLADLLTKVHYRTQQVKLYNITV